MKVLYCQTVYKFLGFSACSQCCQGSGVPGPLGSVPSIACLLTAFAVLLQGISDHLPDSVRISAGETEQNVKEDSQLPYAHPTISVAAFDRARQTASGGGGPSLRIHDLHGLGAKHFLALGSEFGRKSDQRSEPPENSKSDAFSFRAPPENV